MWAIGIALCFLTLFLWHSLSHAGMPGRGGSPVCIRWRERRGRICGHTSEEGGNRLGLLGFSGERSRGRGSALIEGDKRDFRLRYMFRILLCCLFFLSRYFTLRSLYSADAFIQSDLHNASVFNRGDTTQKPQE